MGTRNLRHFQQDIMVFAQPNNQHCLRPLLFNQLRCFWCSASAWIFGCGKMARRMSDNIWKFLQAAKNSAVMVQYVVSRSLHCLFFQAPSLLLPSKGTIGAMSCRISISRSACEAAGRYPYLEYPKLASLTL